MNDERPEEAAPSTAATPSTAAAATGRSTPAECEGAGQAPASRLVGDLGRAVKSLDFGIEKSLRYHQRRRAHYEWMHRLLMLGVLLAGSGAFASFFGKPEYFGLAGAIFGALDLVFQFGGKGRDHELIYRRFAELCQEVRCADDVTPADLKKWTKLRLAIEADEPPIYWAVEQDCYNEVAIARGHPDAAVPLGFWRLALMHIWRFEHANPTPPVKAA